MSVSFDGTAGATFVVNDHHGQRLQLCKSVDIVEVFKVVESFKFAVNSGCPDMILESDCKTIIQAIDNTKEIGSKAGVYIEECCCLKAMIPNIRIHLVDWLGNTIAHALATRLCSCSLPFTLQ